MRLGCIAALVFSVAFGCGSRGGSAKKTETPSEVAEKPGPAPIAAMLHMALEFEAVPRKTPPITQVTLVETNEMGANTRQAIGEFEGECRDATVDVRKTDPKVFLAFHCQPSAGQRGVLVHFLKRQGRLVLLRAWLGATKPTFDEFDQIAELPPYRSGVPVISDFDEAP